MSAHRGAPTATVEEPARHWTPREAELLSVTLQLLQESGYDRLTIDEVAARGHASKATVYRRWPSKAELVLAAFAESLADVAMPPDTGSLREDLLRLARLIAAQARLHCPSIAGVLPEIRRNDRLQDVLVRELDGRRRALIQRVLLQAVDRGEIRREVLSDEIWDLLPGYLVFRLLIPVREVTEATLVALVDDVMLPSLTRGVR